VPAAITTEPPDATLDRGWRLHDQVALRPEPFGALAYHFGNRRLSFLKDPTLVTVVRSLAAHPTARAACRAAGVEDQRMRSFGRAIASLAETGMITAVDTARDDDTVYGKDHA
jgi:mycofactocin biosynthesis protein MftB